MAPTTTTTTTTTTTQIPHHPHVWTTEVEELLEKLRINCVNLSDYHRRRYYHYKGYGKYFRLPLIVLASISSTASVGLQPLIDQQIISGVTCIIGMLMGVLGAVELYLGINASMELELKQSKEFYSLAIDLYKVLSLRRENRSECGKDYLNNKYSIYTKICEASNLLQRQLRVDMLTEIPSSFLDYRAKLTEMDLNSMNEFYEQSGSSSSSIDKYSPQLIKIGHNKTEEEKREEEKKEKEEDEKKNIMKKEEEKSEEEKEGEKNEEIVQLQYDHLFDIDSNV